MSGTAMLYVTFRVSTELVQLVTTVASGAYLVTIAGMTLPLQIKLSSTFIGLILIPIIGSAAEHLNSILDAVNKKTEAALNNTAGYTIQISLFAAPFLILLSALFLGVISHSASSVSNLPSSERRHSSSTPLRRMAKGHLWRVSRCSSSTPSLRWLHSLVLRRQVCFDCTWHGTIRYCGDGDAADEDRCEIVAVAEGAD